MTALDLAKLLLRSIRHFSALLEQAITQAEDKDWLAQNDKHN